MKKWIIISFVVIGLAAGYWKWGGWKASANATQQADKVATAPAEARDIDFAINAAGDIGPADQVSVRPEINGKIATLAVDLGDRVTNGSVLFTLDDQDLQTERASREIEIEGARLQLERARRNFDRSKQLFEDKLISQELYDDTRTEFDLASNALARAQKALDLIKDRLTKTKILAPFDCTVLTRPVSVGQAVSGSGGFNSGTEVLTIANLNEMIINAHINQADVTRLRVGQEVGIEVEAVSGLRLKGEIERIAPQATIRNSIKGFATRIVLKNLDPRVRPGMTANLTIPVASAKNVVSVPLAALFTEMGERYVLVKNGAGFERRPVAIGVADFFYVEIQQGLKAGEMVALEQPPDLAPSLAAQNPPGSGPKLASLQPAASTPAATNTPASVTTNSSSSPASASK